MEGQFADDADAGSEPRRFSLSLVEGKLCVSARNPDLQRWRLVSGARAFRQICLR